MKLKFTLSIFGLLFAMFLFMSNAGGRAAGPGEGNTGAPGDDPKTCGTCHMGGSFGTSISIEVLNSDGEAVTEYVPGTVYTVEATVNTTTAPAGYGLQLVSLLDSDNSDTEGLATPSDNAQIISLGNGRTYLEQNALSSSEVFSAEWTAPASSSGGVTFYASGHAANGNSAAGGDEAAVGTFSVSEMVVSIDNEADLGLKVQPNPTHDFTQISLGQTVNGTVELFDISGKLLFVHSIQGDQYTLDLSSVNNGLYFVKISDVDNQLFETRRIIKQ